MIRRLAVLFLVLAPLLAARGDQLPAASQETWKRLGAQKVNLNLEDTPLADALDLMHDLTSLPIVNTLDVSKDKVTLRVRDVTVGTAFDLLLARKSGARFEVWRGMVIITDAEGRLAPAAKLGADNQKTFGAKKLTFNFAETPLSEVVTFLNDLLGVKLSVAKELGERKVSLRLRDVVALDALEMVSRLARVHAVEKDGKVELVATNQNDAPAPAEQPPARVEDKQATAAAEKKVKNTKVTVNFDATPVADVVAFIQDLTGLNLVADAGVDLDAKVSIIARDLNVEETLALAGFGMKVKDGVVHIEKK